MKGSITVTNLGKAYKQYPHRWSRLAEWLDWRHKPRHRLHWVLQDINFTVKPGEALGIVGINGAGKSTLLKLITGTTQLTTGSVQIFGRVAALLELGMGFHPDFTGRQNAIMAGQLLGLSLEEIRALMSEIEDFADIGEYIDQPVRVYSSGMQMRLAFSVATAQRPDVLIVDEALSVGDAYFQHKSFERIRTYRKLGTTLLLVSHDKSAIQAICDRVILLNASHIAMEGEPEMVMDYYNALLASSQKQTITQKRGENGKVRTVSGTGWARSHLIELLDENNNSIEVVSVGKTVTLHVQVVATIEIDDFVFGFLIKDRFGNSIYGTNTELKEIPIKISNIEEIYDFKISFPVILGPGSYSISIALCSSRTHIFDNYEWSDQAIYFTVVNNSYESFAGCVWMNPSITISSHEMREHICE